MGKIKQIETADVLNCIYEGTPVYMLIRCNEETTFAEAIDADAFVIVEECAEENKILPIVTVEGKSVKDPFETVEEHTEEHSEIASEEDIENALPPDVPDKYPAKPKKKAKNKNKNEPVKKVDHGRIIALRRGGWPVAKIADDIGCSEQTVYNHLKSEGLR